MDLLENAAAALISSSAVVSSLLIPSDTASSGYLLANLSANPVKSPPQSSPSIADIEPVTSSVSE